MIRSIPEKLAKWLANRLAIREDELEVYVYGLEIILGGIFKIVLLILIAFQLNILSVTVLCTLGFVGIRFFAGGVHLCTYTRCLVGSLAIFLIFGKIATYNLNLNFFFVLIFITLSLGVYSIIKWVPAGTHKKTVTDHKLRTKQKIKTFITLVIFIGISLIFVQYQLISWAFSLAYGVLASFFLITPLGYLFMQNMDKILDLLPQKQGARFG